MLGFVQALYPLLLAYGAAFVAIPVLRFPLVMHHVEYALANKKEIRERGKDNSHGSRHRAMLLSVATPP
jgi:hypothetical protein